MDGLFDAYGLVSESGLFDAAFYLATYPEVAERNVDPLIHYLESGWQEGHDPHPDFDTAFYLEQCRSLGEEPENPLLHFLRSGAARGLKTRPDDIPADSPVNRDVALPDEPAKLPNVIVVESLGVAGAAGAGLRLSINGWAIAASPIVEVAATLDGRVVGTAIYGLARPDIAAQHPGHAGADHSGYILSFELPSQASRTIELMLTVRTADGEVGRRPLRVDVPPQDFGAGAAPLADAGSTQRDTAKPPMQLYVDEVFVDEGGMLRIEGWVICLVQIESVEASIDDQRIGGADFGRVREDIAAAFPGYPNSRFSGFSLVSDIRDVSGPRRRMVRVRAVARTGISREVTAFVDIPETAAPPAVAPDTPLHHHCDEITLTTAGRIGLKGWIVGALPTTGLTIFLDGEEVGQADFGIERPDVGNHFPIFPHARQSGFLFHRRAEKPLQGEHLLTLRVRQEDGQTQDILLPALAVEAEEPEEAVARNETVGELGTQDHPRHADPGGRRA